MEVILMVILNSSYSGRALEVDLLSSCPFWRLSEVVVESLKHWSIGVFLVERLILIPVLHCDEVE
jgi:hypothetical protein